MRTAAASSTISSLRPGQAASIAAEVVGCGIRPTRRPRFKIFELLVRDETGSLKAVFPNQAFLNDVFRPHQRVILFGKLELTAYGMQFQNPQYEILKAEGDDPAEAAPAPGDKAEDDTLHTGRIVPVYEKTGTLTPKMQRALVHRARWRRCPSEIPSRCRPASCAPAGLSIAAPLHPRRPLSRRRARRSMQLNAFRTPAHRRLIFEEFFLFQLGLVLRKRRAEADRKAAPWSSPTRSARRSAGCCRSG
jgi:ATP-dependent DNA helicase RecG